jgi:16S rRNA (cytosine967-C5)-methyltransferase
VSEPARRVALDLLRRIDDGAYANVVVPSTLDRLDLDRRDRAFVTELVYGTTRMRRACDFLVDRFLLRPVDPPVRDVLRMGAYQLRFLRVPAHASVSATVGVAPRAARGLVNAVLRRIAEADVKWPDAPTRLSYPDWIVDRLGRDLGPDDGPAALERMNEAPQVTRRADGYVQGLASQWVAALTAAQPGDLVADLCASPGGKATAIAASGARVIAGDRNRRRSGLVRENALTLGLADRVAVLTAAAEHPALRSGRFDRVLIDAPCSGLGTLRRRADARWRIEPDAVVRLATLQCEMVDAAVPLLRPGGTLVYSVCTLTAEETLGVDEHLGRTHPELQPVEPPGLPWRTWGRGALLLPQAADTDGMALFRYRTATE